MKIKMFSRFSNRAGRPEKQKMPGREHMGFQSILSDLTSTKSILPKMILVFLMLIIIPVTTIGFIATSSASRDLRESAEQSVVSATKQTSGYFDAFLAKAKDISIQIIGDTFIRAYSSMNQDTADPMDYLTAQMNVNSILTGMNTASSDLNAKLLFNNARAFGDMSPPEDMDKMTATAWYKKVLEADGKPVWVDYGESFPTMAGKYALSLVRIYKNSVSGKVSGTIFVDVNYKPVTDVLAGIDLGKGDSTYLVTTYGKVLSKEGQSEGKNTTADRAFVKEVLERSAQKASDFFYTSVEGEKSLVSYCKSASTGLIAVMVAPEKNILAGADKIKRTTILTGVLFVLVAGAFGFLFSLGMTFALKSVMGAMSKAQHGDLTASLFMKRKDEFGKVVASFNDMMANIKNLVFESKTAVGEVAVSSEKMADISSQSSRISSEIAHAIVEVASGSANQASEIEASVKNVTELADKISLAVERTHTMEADSDSMKELSAYGLTTIESLSDQNAKTNEITANVVQEISKLNQYVKNINVITQVLRSIADQTNLLSLNAAIEAARAGESGKGFAVVAEEIRKLAEQSNNRTREIQVHIENIFKQAQSSTLLVGKAEASIREQSEMVARTAEAFKRINETTAALTRNIQNIGSMIGDMDSNKEKVLSSMENISAVSEQVSASTQEVSASTQQQLASIEQLDDMAKKLNELAEKLIRQMEKFKV